MAPKITIPTSATELEEMLNTPAVLKNVMTDPELRKEFLAKYAVATMEKDGSLKAQINEQLQLGLAEFVKSSGGDAGNPLNRAGVAFRNGKPQLQLAADGTRAVSMGRGAVYNKDAPGAGLERKYKAEDRFTSIGELCAAIREERSPSTSAMRNDYLRKLENTRSFQNSFGSEDPGSGGFLIPEEMRSELLQLALENSIVRSRATVLPMSTLRVSVPTVDDTSHATSVFGGIEFYWAEESSTLTESTATFGKIVLDAKKLTGYFAVPNELLADAPAFSGFFDSRVPQGLAFFEDIAFLTETGAGTPQGVIGTNNPAYIQATRTGSSDGDGIAWSDIVGMYARMLPQSLSSAVWIAAIDTFPQLAQLSQSEPGIWLGGWAARDASDAPPVNIMGRPVIFTEKVPKLNSVGDLSFVDLSYYLIGDRQSVAVSASEHYKFQSDQTAYRIIERVDGRPWVQTPLTPHNGSSSTLSPYVGLAAGE